MHDPVESIRQYVLAPDDRGSHLRQLAEHMAGLGSADVPMSAGMAAKPEAGDRRTGPNNLHVAADTVASFIYLVWGHAGPEVYAPRTLEMLGLQGRVRGMEPNSTWPYAISVFAADLRARLRRAADITIDPGMETALLHHFFDGVEEFSYLHDVVEHIQELHWQRRHQPGAPAARERGPAGLIGPRGEPALEKHLRRAAIESLATYIEQANIARGKLEDPTDPAVVLRDRMEIQVALGGKNPQTWAASGRELADRIEGRFGTAQGRKEARQARIRWKAIARQRGPSRRAGM